MAVDPEKQISGLWKALQGSQESTRKTFYQMRQVLLEVAGPDANPFDLGVKAWDFIGKDMGKANLPRMNLLKGVEGLMMNVARAYQGLAATNGAVVNIEKGENTNELFIKWLRCPWPTAAKENGVSMDEDLKGCDAYLQAFLEEVNAFLGTNLKIETLKAIPSGDGVCIRRLYNPEDK
ncbi:MAG: hypothetical protein ACOC6B_05305 [Thermodesulfobacteriota bacterium]